MFQYLEQFRYGSPVCQTDGKTEGLSPNHLLPTHAINGNPDVQS